MDAGAFRRRCAQNPTRTKQRRGSLAPYILSSPFIKYSRQRRLLQDLDPDEVGYIGEDEALTMCVGEGNMPGALDMWQDEELTDLTYFSSEEDHRTGSTPFFDGEFRAEVYYAENSGEEDLLPITRAAAGLESMRASIVDTLVWAKTVAAGALSTETCIAEGLVSAFASPYCELDMDAICEALREAMACTCAPPFGEGLHVAVEESKQLNVQGLNNKSENRIDFLFQIFAELEMRAFVRAALKCEAASGGANQLLPMLIENLSTADKPVPQYIRIILADETCSNSSEESDNCSLTSGL